MTRDVSWSEQKSILRELQDGRCGACRVPDDGLHLDHDHDTGQTRGLLCIGCNVNADKGARPGIAQYLRSPPAEDFGWEYQDSFGRWALDLIAAQRRKDEVLAAGRKVSTMAEWSVLVESKAPAGGEDPKVEDGRLGDLLAALSDWGASVGGDRRGWDVRLTVEAEAAGDACVEGQALVEAHAMTLGLPAWQVDRLEAVSSETLDKELAVSNFPDIVGSNEAAEILGVSRQRLHTLREKADFPLPIKRLAATDVYLRAAIEAFNDRWERKPGRPRSAVDSARAVDKAISGMPARTAVDHVGGSDKATR